MEKRSLEHSSNHSSVFEPAHKRSQSSITSIFSIFSQSSFQRSPEVINSATDHSFTQNSSNSQNSKNLESMIKKLNEEITILSSQLNQSNQAISYLSQSLQENSETLGLLLKEKEALKEKNRSFESENEDLREKIEIFVRSKENDSKKSELEKEAYVLTCEKKMIEIQTESKKERAVIEQRFIDMIINMNHKFIQETEIFNRIERIKKEDSGKVSDFSTSSIPELLNADKFSIFSSPGRRKSAEFDYLDLSFKNSSVQAGEIVKSRFEKIEAVKKVFEFWAKGEMGTAKKALRTWRFSQGKVRVILNKVCFRANCVFFICLVKEEKFLGMRRKIIKKAYFRRWKNRWKLDKTENGKIFKLFGFAFVVNKKILMFKKDFFIRINKKDRVKDRRLLKKCIDQWSDFRNLNSQMVCQAFYLWKSSASLLKMLKLQSFKSLFYDSK